MFSIKCVFRYYDQLCAMDGKFPLEENQVRIPFRWKDAFDKGSLFGSKMSLSKSKKISLLLIKINGTKCFLPLSIQVLCFENIMTCLKRRKYSKTQL